MANFIIFAWIGIHGSAFVWAWVRWLPDARYLQRHATQRLKSMSDGHVQAAYATIAVSSTMMFLGVSAVAFPGALGSLTPITLTAATAVAYLPVFLYSRQLKMQPEIARLSDRWTLFQIVFGIGMLVTLIILMALAAGRALLACGV